MEHTYEDIIYSKSDRVARITINRPEAANMFRAKTLHEMNFPSPVLAFSGNQISVQDSVFTDT